jgi:hypothetical protein
VASGEIKSAAAAAKAKGGIPWNDSPKMPAQFTPSPVLQPAAGVLPSGPPSGGGTSPGGVPRAALSNGGGTPPIGNSVHDGASAVGAPSPEVICSTCGKAIAPGFAFCGSCGARVAPAAPAQAASPARTMYMAGPQPSAAPAQRGRLVLIRPDGSERGAPSLRARTSSGVVRVSSSTAAHLSPRHGEFLVGPEGVSIKDLRSLNGVFLKITQEEALESGDIFRIGQELLRFEIISAPQPLEDGTEIMGTPNPGFWGRLSVVVGRDVDGSAFPLFGDAIVLGRERGDVLFPEDGYVSVPTPIAINEGQVPVGSRVVERDVPAHRTERRLPAGSFVLIGQQLFGSSSALAGSMGTL